MPVELNPLFELVVDGATLGAFIRDQLAAIRAAVSHLLARSRRDQILLVVTDFFGLEPDELLKNKSRCEYIVWPRHAAITLLHDHGLSSLTIGEIFHQDHATILSALTRTRERIETDPIQAKQLERLRALLSSVNSVASC